MSLILKSDAFESGENIPSTFTCDGRDVSPPINWQGAPAGTESFAVIVDDPDAPNGVFCHWVIYNIPPGMTRLDENLPFKGEFEWGAVQGRNDFGHTRYGGPCPPRGPAHHYYFRLYALDTELEASAGATRAQVMDMMKGHILEQTEMIGLYARS